MNHGQSAFQNGRGANRPPSPVAAVQTALFPFSFLILILTFTPAFAAQTTAPAPESQHPSAPSGVSSSQLNDAINQTIHERKYIYRMPREKIQDTDANEGPIARFFEKTGEMFRNWARDFAHWLGHLVRAFMDWLNKLFGRNNPSYDNSSSSYGWIEGVWLLVWLLIAVVVTGLIIFLYRVWRNRFKVRTPVATQAILSVPDVSDENVAADQLPEDEWMKLGRELLARGELRLAMRAFYLASLAHLASRNLISIARFKSNREYERELLRRGHSFPELLSTFGQNISVFEAIWYGMHDVNPDSVNQFALNVERIKSGG